MAPHPHNTQVVSSKIFNHYNNVGLGPNEIGLSRKHLREGMEGILERLGPGMDYVDVIRCASAKQRPSALSCPTLPPPNVCGGCWADTVAPTAQTMSRRSKRPCVASIR